MATPFLEFTYLPSLFFWLAVYAWTVSSWKLFFARMKIREAVCLETPNFLAAEIIAPCAGTITPSSFVERTRMYDMIDFTTSLLVFFLLVVTGTTSATTLSLEETESSMIFLVKIKHF
jgi:phospholipid N-methyltransferase